MDSFLLPLPVDRLPGVGKVTGEKLKQLEVQTIADLRRMDLPTLEARFGRYGVRLYELARGIDNSEVVPDRPTQSISAEDTFEQDVLLAETIIPTASGRSPACRRYVQNRFSVLECSHESVADRSPSLIALPNLSA